jgi:predicted dehydrogenase
MTKPLPGPIRVGVVGCGNVSRQYLANLATASELEFVTCADIVDINAEVIAHEFGLRKAASVAALLEDPEVDLVLNLTLPSSHAQASLQALAEGKHLYTEKPIATALDDAKAILLEADRRGLLVGSAPDSFLSAGHLFSAELVRDGSIGLPVSVNAFMLSPGPDQFHPNPEFLFSPGAGPLFDMGPYYLTVLVAMFGSIARVGALSSTTRAERIIKVGDRTGSTFEVGTPTHIASLLEFSSGVLGTLVTSFDAVGSRVPSIEVHGLEGSIITPAANSWSGPVLIKKAGDDDFLELPTPVSAVPSFMGMGLIEMASALQKGCAPAATASRAQHVLEVMCAILDSGSSGGNFVEITPPEQDLTSKPTTNGEA